MGDTATYKVATDETKINAAGDIKKEEKAVKEEKKESEENEEESGSKNDDSIVSNPDPFFPPIVYLPEVVVNSGEDEEIEVFKIRARLYRYAHECDPVEWKERGTGDIRILQHEINNTCRIVMRREKTMRLCANHFIQPWMKLSKHSANDKAWIWNTYADFADEVKKPETLAVRFSTVEKAQKWKEAFDKAARFMLDSEAESYLKEKNTIEKVQVKEATSTPTTKDSVSEKLDDKENVKEQSDEVSNKLENLTVN